MRPGEGFVDIVVHHVATEVAGASDAEDCVHVRTVDVNETANVVQHLRNLRNVSLEDAECVGVRDHEDGSVLVKLRLQFVQVHEPVWGVLELYALKAGDGGTRWVCPVSTGWEQHLRSLFAAIMEVRSGAEQGGHFTVSSRCWLQ